MKTQVYDNMFRTTIICIDQYENRIPCGRIYNMYLENGIVFRSTMELLSIVDGMLEEMDYPQSYSVRRAFWSAEDRRDTEKVSATVKVGKEATFGLRILFRQNASWQGSVVWYEGKREESFRSVLELLFLLDSALGAKDSEKSAEV